MNLLEVVISFYLFIILSITCSKIERYSIQVLQNDYYYNLAINQAYALSERFLVNQDSAYRQREIEHWKNENAQLLPDARGSVACSKGICRISISWREYFSQKILSCEL